jgi:hypothetical protein
MRPTTRLATLAALVVATGCASVAPIPIPMVGTRTDIDALAGEWRGSYNSAETGRGGTINFTLAAGRDTAFGEVIMIPNRYNVALEPVEMRVGEPRNRPQLLTITFVRAGGRTVRGTLDQYIDPDCGCPMRTSFTGAFTGENTLEGTFESQTSHSTALLRGEWSANRVAKRVATTP